MNHYGWNPDKPDIRDLKYRLSYPLSARTTPILSKTDLRPKCPEIWNQGDIGSCTGHGTAFAIMYDDMRQGDMLPVMPSRLMLYYDGRVIEGTQHTDSGAEIRDVIKAAANGVCRELWWPYDTTKALVAPSSWARRAAKEKALTYHRLDNTHLDELRACLSDGFPFVFGFSVYDGFESDETAKTGIVPMPDASKETMLGGHCVACVGHDDEKQVFIVRNSWGAEWGDHGYCYMPYAYLTTTDLAEDFWTIQAVS